MTNHADAQSDTHSAGHEPHAGHAHATNHHAAELHPHIVPLRVLAAVWVALMILTVVTVGVTRWDFGELNLWIAMAIATLKASLVALYFMHLRYDSPFHGIVLIISLLFVMLFIGLALMDTGQYQPTLIPDYAPLIDR